MEMPPGLSHHWSSYGNSTLELGAAATQGRSGSEFVVRFFLCAAVWVALNAVFQGAHLQRLRVVPPRPAAWEFVWQTYVARRHPAVVLHNLVKRHGPVMQFRAWSQDFLVLSSVAAVEEFYKLHDMEFGARPSSMGRLSITNTFNCLWFPPLATYWNHLHFVLDLTSSEPGIAWALEALGQHSEVVDRVCEELERNWRGELEEPDLAKLPYLQAVVKELFRLYPPCVVSFPHKASDREFGTRLFGFGVGTRTQVLINIYSLQRDPVMWGRNAEEFDPVRFVAHPEVGMHGHHFQLLPFGGGQRRCPGTKLTILRVQLGLARHFTKHLLER